MTAADFDAARSKAFTRDELRVIVERAQDCASHEQVYQTHSTWAVRAAIWQALAEAAYACGAMMGEDELYGIFGVPPQRGSK